MKIEVSNAEILDKFSILSIKLEKIKDKNKVSNVYTEYKYLNRFYDEIIQKNKKIIKLYNQLKNINLQLWEIEDNIRIKENKLSFDEEFINLARNVYKYNDERSRIKKEINILTKSNFIEEKSYE